MNLLLLAACLDISEKARGKTREIRLDLGIEALQLRIRGNIGSGEGVVKMARSVDDGQLGLPGIDDKDRLELATQLGGEVFGIPEGGQGAAVTGRLAVSILERNLIRVLRR